MEWVETPWFGGCSPQKSMKRGHRVVWFVFKRRVCITFWKPKTKSLNITCDCWNPCPINNNYHPHYWAKADRGNRSAAEGKEILSGWSCQQHIPPGRYLLPGAAPATFCWTVFFSCLIPLQQAHCSSPPSSRVHSCDVASGFSFLLKGQECGMRTELSS